MLSNFLDNYIKYEYKGNTLRFRAITIDGLFKLLKEEEQFVFWLFENLATENGKILEETYDFKDYMISKYPRVIKSIVCICYVPYEEEEKMTFKEKVAAFENLDFNIQLEIFHDICKKTFKGVFSDVKKTKALLLETQKIFGMNTTSKKDKKEV